jgi:hypothetical protein
MASNQSIRDRSDLRAAPESTKIDVPNSAQVIGSPDEAHPTDEEIKMRYSLLALVVFASSPAPSVSILS